MLPQRRDHRAFLLGLRRQVLGWLPGDGDGRVHVLQHTPLIQQQFPRPRRQGAGDASVVRRGRHNGIGSACRARCGIGRAHEPYLTQGVKEDQRDLRALPGIRLHGQGQFSAALRQGKGISIISAGLMLVRLVIPQT